MKYPPVSVLNTVARWLFILCLPVMLLTAGIAIAVNCSWLYEYGFDKYDVGSTTGLEGDQLKKAADGLIDYFNSDEENISVTVIKNDQPLELFNEREVAHLKDVKDLFQLNYWVLVGTLSYILVYACIYLFYKKREYRPILARAVLYSSALTLIIMLVVGLVALLDFDDLFWQFHIISFDNDLWRLDPATDYLIMLFPQGFWYDATVFCAVGTTGGAIIMGITSWLYLRKKRASFRNEY
jgi:integral membrane protein (TIGR01906 family)